MKVLTIGINNYIDERISDLSGCVNDAKNFLTYIKTRNNIFPNITSKALLNRQATKSNVITSLDWLFKRTNIDDKIRILFWSSHGTQITDHNSDEIDHRDEAFVCVDADFHNKGLLTDDELHAILRKNRAHGYKVLIIADSCFSGGMSRSTKSKSKAIGIPRFINILEDYDVFNTNIKATIPNHYPGQDVTFVFASFENEVSYENEVNGIITGDFTRTLLEKLSINTEPKDLGLIIEEVKSVLTQQTPVIITASKTTPWSL